MEGEGLRAVELSLEDLQTRFKKHRVTATLQCTGNRRDDLNAVKPVKGLEWSVGARAIPANCPGVPVRSGPTEHTLMGNQAAPARGRARLGWFSRLGSSSVRCGLMKQTLIRSSGQRSCSLLQRHSLTSIDLGWSASGLQVQAGNKQPRSDARGSSFRAELVLEGPLTAAFK